MYMAWLGTDASAAAARIGARTTGTPGWIRPDGKPFTSSLADLLAGTIYYPAADRRKRERCRGGEPPDGCCDRVAGSDDGL